MLRSQELQMLPLAIGHCNLGGQPSQVPQLTIRSTQFDIFPKIHHIFFYTFVPNLACVDQIGQFFRKVPNS